MILIEKTEIMGFEQAMRGMRNPMNSWSKSDSEYICDHSFQIGENDRGLMMSLAKGGPVHGKFRRMISVYLDITAPLYWWKEFDTYKVGTVANSCSTMHKIHEKEFTIDDFSHEHLLSDWIGGNCEAFVYTKDDAPYSPKVVLGLIIKSLNACRDAYLKTKDKKYWWGMIQLLPASYNQKRTVMLNYEVLAGIYAYRRKHKLDEWRIFCEWIEDLPHSEVIVCGFVDDR
jgi:hypothetical protein